MPSPGERQGVVFSCFKIRYRLPSRVSAAKKAWRLRHLRGQPALFYIPAHPLQACSGSYGHAGCYTLRKVATFGMSDNGPLSNMAWLSQLLQKTASPAPTRLPSLH